MQQQTPPQPPVPAKPRYFQPIASPTTPPLPPPPSNYTATDHNLHCYSSDSAIGSPNLSGNSVSMTTNDDLDELSRLDNEGPILEPNDSLSPGRLH